MNPRIKRYTVLTLTTTLLAFALACNLGDETDKANKLIDEGNQMVTDGNKLVQDATAKNNQLYDNLNDANFADEQARLKTTAQEAVEGFDKSAAKYRDAAQKFEDASKLKVNDKFKEYLSLKAQEFRKNAEGAEVGKSLSKAFIDSSDGPTLLKKINELKPRVETLSKEATDFQEKAEKIRTDNKDKFKS
jgi:hypothetical protein